MRGSRYEMARAVTAAREMTAGETASSPVQPPFRDATPNPDGSLAQVCITPSVVLSISQHHHCRGISACMVEICVSWSAMISFARSRMSSLRPLLSTSSAMVIVPRW